MFFQPQEMEVHRRAEEDMVEAYDQGLKMSAETELKQLFPQ